MTARVIPTRPATRVCWACHQRTHGIDTGREVVCHHCGAIVSGLGWTLVRALKAIGRGIVVMIVVVVLLKLVLRLL
jgi:hypothetical protein